MEISFKNVLLLPLRDFFSFFYENVAWASRERPRIYLVTPYARYGTQDLNSKGSKETTT